MPASPDNPRGNTMGVASLVFGLVQLWLAVLALILGIAFVLNLLGANPEASFAQWIYNRSAEIMTPFNGLFDPIQITSNSQIQTSLLFAMLVYVVLAALVGAVSRRVQGW